MIKEIRTREAVGLNHTPTNTFNYWWWHYDNIEQLKMLFSYDWVAAKYAVYPEEGGIILCGADSNGCYISWVTEGRPEDWPIIYFDNSWCSYDRYDMNLSTFLLKLAKREIKPAVHSNTDIYCGLNDTKQFVALDECYQEYISRTEQNSTPAVTPKKSTEPVYIIAR